MKARRRVVESRDKKDRKIRAERRRARFIRSSIWRLNFREGSMRIPRSLTKGVCGRELVPR